MVNDKIEYINENIQELNEILSIAQKHSLDHDYAIDIAGIASRLNDHWKAIVEAMINDPSEKPDLEELIDIEY